MSKLNAYLYGLHAVTALLQQKPQWVKQLIIKSQDRNPELQRIEKQAESLQIPIQHQSAQAMNRLFDQPTVHQGVVAECVPQRQYHEGDLESLLQDKQEAQKVLILDGVQDPHNLGACLRSAAAFEVGAVIAPKDKSVGLTPAVYKVSCGGAFIVPFIPVTNLARAMRLLQELQFWIVGLAGDAEKTLQQVDMKGNIAMALGSEGYGLRPLTQKHCDFMARIPMTGPMESLNVSVASAICLYEAANQSRG